MATILRLNDNPNIIVKPDYQPITVTGATFYNFIASGATTLTQTQVGNQVSVNIYTPLGTSVEWTDVLNKPDLWTTGQTVSYINSQGFITSLAGYWTSGETTSYINSKNYLTGVTWNDIDNKPVLFSGDYDDLSNKPALFDGDYYSLSNLPTLFDGDYNSLSNLPSLFDGDYDSLSNKPDLSIYLTGVTTTQITGVTVSLYAPVVHYHPQYLTGFTVTAPMVTGITASLYAPVVHTHDYDTLNDLPVLFSGDYDDLSNKPDLNALPYLKTTGGTITGALNGTSLQLSGDLTVDGTMHIVHAEEVYTENDFIFMRSGATSGLGVGQVSGIAALNVDGLGTTAVLGVTNDGIIRVGWSGDTLLAVACREDLPVNDAIAVWNAGDAMFITTGMTMTELTSELNSKSNTGHTHDYDTLTDLPTLFSGDYDDLSNKPVLFDGDYDSLSNKPVLFSGDYDDLTDKPTLGTIAPKNFWTGTEAEYAALGSYDNNTLYFCT
jgi:hypothetical protein